MTIRLIIKGTEAEANGAAYARDILLDRARKGAHSTQFDGYIETCAECQDVFWPQVRAWYHENPQDNPPYPVGTLLWCDCEAKRLEDKAHDADIHAALDHEWENANG